MLPPHAVRTLPATARRWPSRQPAALHAEQTACSGCGTNKSALRSDSHRSHPVRRLPAIWFPFLQELVSFLGIFLSGLTEPSARSIQHSEPSQLLLHLSKWQLVLSEQRGVSVMGRGECFHVSCVDRPAFALTALGPSEHSHRRKLTKRPLERWKQSQLTGPGALASVSTLAWQQPLPAWTSVQPIVSTPPCFLHLHSSDKFAPGAGENL